MENKTMNIKEVTKYNTLNNVFSKSTDPAFRQKVFNDVFDNLFEDKVVIHNRFTCIARIEKIEILPESFSAFIIPETFIRTDTPSDKRQEKVFEKLKRGWEISCKWEYMSILGNSLCSTAYANWLIWVDSQTVELTEKLTKQGQNEEALKLTLYENEKKTNR